MTQATFMKPPTIMKPPTACIALLSSAMNRLLTPLMLLLAMVGQAHAQSSALELETGQGRVLRFGNDVASVLVANPDIADVQVVSPGVIYVFGKQHGDTNLIALANDESTQASMRLHVSDGDQGANRALQNADAGSPIQLRMAGNQLVAEGQNQSIEGAIATQSTLDQHAPAEGATLNNATYSDATQINLRVRFAEVAREELLQYGVSWSALINNGSFSLGIFPGSMANASFGTIADGIDGVDGLLQALQENGLLQILAEPNITAVTGETASFLAGGEIPIPVPAGNDLVGIQYKQFGVSLMFTPVLLPNGRISLEVRPEVSTLTENGVEIGGTSVPGLQVRRADTVVEVGSGQTFAIAGLFQREASNNVEQIPVLGDLPILGNLFRSRSFQRNETELVILITPYIVAPAPGRSLRTPLDQGHVSNGAMRVDGQAAPEVVRNDPFGFYLQ
ncbi:type II and III secretion system protein family protein [Halomonas cupida]|uniref:Pilus assembly protein CpaC n=2 Tax=Halomonas cupida TaxID=44933 RepID=A0A1M7EAF3_9GAMM|nr:type II and III secretion system protein family protein [Halomonas cupida]SHL88610.1 pilus assembly protein CpaC [Halomonas cupida]